jgi:hypothetical protein
MAAAMSQNKSVDQLDAEIKELQVQRDEALKASKDALLFLQLILETPTNSRQRFGYSDIP